MRRQYREVCCTKDEAKALNTDVSRMGFLYKKIPMPNNCMMLWLRVPEFTDKLNSMIDNGITIDPAVFLETAIEILAKKN